MLAILQHSYFSANVKLIPPACSWLLWYITHLAAITFVSISGAMFAFFLYTRSKWSTTYRRYALRAVFLVLLAHPAINLASYPFRMIRNGPSASFGSFLQSMLLEFPITDTIAVCLLVSPVLILCFGPRLRGVTVVTLWLMAPLIAAFVNPVEPSLLIFKEAIFGVLGNPSVFWYPLARWLAIFLAGSLVGEALARLKTGTLTSSTLVREMNKAGTVLFACSVIATMGYKLLKIRFGQAWIPELFLAIYPGQTTTLLPGYLAVLAWLFAALVRRIDMSGQYDRFLWFLSVLGRTSLFTFVIQFAVVESAPALLGLKGTLGLVGFLILFVSGLGVVWILAYGYGRLRGWFSANDYGECVAAAGARQGHRA